MMGFEAMNWMVIAGLGVAFAIAWITPFDRAFAAATFGIPLLRGVSIGALAVAGASIGARIDLAVGLRGCRPVAFTLAVTVLVALGCALVDWLFRRSLPAGYVELIASPVAPRTLLFMARAFNENIIYRLFLGSALTWVVGQLWKRGDGKPAKAAYAAGFTAAQLVNVWINVTSHAPLTTLGLTHDLLRYVVPGLVWAWLYARRGFASNEIACTSVHLLLQPLLTVLI